MIFAQLNCVVVDPDATNRQEMAAFLGDHGASVSAMLPSIEALRALMHKQTETVHIVIVNIDPHTAESIKLLAPLIKEFRSTSFFVMSQTVDASILMDVIHIGAREFIPLPMRPERLLASIERVAAASDDDQRRARIIQIIPVSGGCGATTIACNVAATLARAGRTLLLDLDLVCGGAATNFNLTPRYTIADVMISGGTLDKHLVENAIVTHEQTGLCVLARPDQPDDALRVNRNGLNRLLGVVARQFEYVVIDSMMSADPLYLAASQAADINALVLELNVPAARNAERFVATLRRLGFDTDKIRIIVNRFEKRGSDIKPEDLEKTLGLKVAWTVPNDFKNAVAAINFGQPVVVRTPRAEMAGSISGLAQMLNGKGRH